MAVSYRLLIAFSWPRLAVVIVPTIDRQMLLRFLAKRSGIELDWNEEMLKEALGRMPGRVSAYEAALESLLLEIRALDFSEMAPKQRAKQKRFGKFLKERVEVLSALTGCPVTWDVTEPLSDSESFDFGMATTFFLISLLICRTTALDRSATVGWEDDAVRVSFLFGGTSDDLLWGREALDWCAEERQMHFGFEYRDERIYLSIKPRRLEFSYLGIKAEDWLL